MHQRLIASWDPGLNIRTKKTSLNPQRSAVTTSFFCSSWLVCFVGFLCISAGFFFSWQEEQKELDEITAKRQKKGKNEEEAPAEEKTILHGEKSFFFFLTFLLDNKVEHMLKNITGQPYCAKTLIALNQPRCNV